MSNVHMVAFLFFSGAYSLWQGSPTAASASNSTPACKKKKGQDLQVLQERQQQVLYQALDLYLDLCLQEGQELQYQQELQEERVTYVLVGL